MSNPNGASTSIPWTKINPTQNVEGCLKMFTSIEVLDGDNMFGCHNCWKIANGQAPVMKPLVSDKDSKDSSDSNEQQENQRMLSPLGLDHKYPQVMALVKMQTLLSSNPDQELPTTPIKVSKGGEVEIQVSAGVGATTAGLEAYIIFIPIKVDDDGKLDT
ncbi:hypothetical protein BU17DRAFT_85284 [Hysterangium stoloniferum]|nr:hypothetical protein BU17DRAFT_85284 [Hysterangium stoloniferum]